jgi:hypothetical protein
MSSRSKGVTKVPFAFSEKSITIDETEYKFKELSVGENDFCADGSKNEKGDIDGRKMMRLMVVKSSVEPKLTLEDIADVPNRIYLKFCEVVNDLNMPDEDETDEGNG